MTTVRSWSRSNSLELSIPETGQAGLVVLLSGSVIRLTHIGWACLFLSVKTPWPVVLVDQERGVQFCSPAIHSRLTSARTAFNSYFLLAQACSPSTLKLAHSSKCVGLLSSCPPSRDPLLQQEERNAHAASSREFKMDTTDSKCLVARAPEERRLGLTHLAPTQPDPLRRLKPIPFQARLLVPPRLALDLPLPSGQHQTWDSLRLVSPTPASAKQRKRPARASQYDLESRTALFTFAMLVRLLASLLLVSLGRTALADGSSSVARADSYRETLRLTPFPDGKVHSEFSFRLEGAWRDEGLAVSQNAVVHDHTLLPRLLTSLVRQHRVASFHLTLSSGRWQPTWPLHLPAEVPASGIELTAWLERLEGETNEDERERWEAFTSAVSGLFCAGVVADGVKTSTSSPTWTVSFDGEGDEREYSLYRLTMPRLAAACTESLTPFLSLLPCSYHAGLSSLLNPHRLFDGDFTLIGVKFLLKEAEEMAAFELEIGSVLDPVRKDRLTGQLGRREFSISSLYDRTLATACPVASDSRIELVVPTHSVNPFSIEPDLAREVTKIDGREVAVWDVKQALETAALDVRVTWPGESVFRNPSPSKLPQAPIAVRRLLFGVGQERGRIGVELINNEEVEHEIVWSEVWPWWLRAFVSTLETQTDGQSAPGKSDQRILDLDYIPAIARERPTTLQALIRLPPKSATRLTLAYESASLWYTEYPSDSNRGFSVPGATVVLLPPLEGGSSSPRRQGVLRSRRPVLRLQTPTTLLSLPTPDFSMPYNVIILTSTVMALFFGSVMNGMIRRWWIVDVGGSGPGERVLTLNEAILQLVRPHAYDPDELDYGEDELVMDVGAEQAPLSGSEVSPEPLLGEREASVAAMEVEDEEGSSSREEGEVEEDDHGRRSDSETLQAPSHASSRLQSGQQSSHSSYSYEAPPRWVSTLAPELGQGPSSAPSTNTFRRRSADERPVRSPSWEGKKPKSAPYDRSFAQSGRSARRNDQLHSHVRSTAHSSTPSSRPPLPPRRRNTFSEPQSPTRSSMREAYSGRSAFGPGGRAPMGPSSLPTPTASPVRAAQDQPSLLSRIDFQAGEAARARSDQLAKPSQARFVPAQDVPSPTTTSGPTGWPARDAPGPSSAPYPPYYPSSHPPPPHAPYPPHPSSYPPPSHGYYPPHYHYPPYSSSANTYAGAAIPQYPPAYSSPPSHPSYAPLPPLHPQPHVPPHASPSGLEPTLAMTAMQVGLTVIAQQQTAAFAMQQRMAVMASTSAAQQSSAAQAQPQREAETTAVPMRMGARSEKKLTGRQRARRKQLKEQEEARMHE
ncbi:GPI transamidase component PIG-T [Rhodotorula toruloides]|nr:GPI transamidase component PIG-T [Rhodotorula toruloides]